LGALLFHRRRVEKIAVLLGVTTRAQLAFATLVPLSMAYARIVSSSRNRAVAPLTSARPKTGYQLDQTVHRLDARF